MDILLAAKEQTTILFSTHILSDVERICTEVAFLNDGKIALQGTIAELRNKQSSNGFIIEIEKKEVADMLGFFARFKYATFFVKLTLHEKSRFARQKVLTDVFDGYNPT